MKLIGWEVADGSTQRGQSIISAIALFTVVGEQDSETNDVFVFQITEELSYLD